jgi:hypothetical protein
MRGRLAGLALELYPMAFRRRYGQEMRALLVEAPPGVSTVLDLFRGALAAHLRPPAALAGFVDTGDRLRASMSGVLACWVVFAAAGFGFYKTTEDHPFGAAGSAHAVLGGTHLTIQILAVVGSLAVLAGGLPLSVLALHCARRRRSLRMLVSLPIVAVAVFMGLTGVLILVAQSQRSQHPSTAGGVVFIAWGLAGLACGAVCVLASRKALFAMPVPRGWLLAAFACGALVTAAMVAMTVATAIYTIALSVDASALGGEPNGPLQAISVSVSLIEQLIVMVIAGVLAATTTRRGWRAVSQSGGADRRMGG